MERRSQRSPNFRVSGRLGENVLTVAMYADEVYHFFDGQALWSWLCTLARVT
jgi:hypothetical protein